MTRLQSKDILLVALGGNALIREGQEGTVAQQMENLRVPVRQIAHLSERYRIIITHGNGPQVGDLMLQQESCREVPRAPLEVLVARTQGQIGYMIESALDSEFMSEGIDAQKYLVSLISYVVVDPDDAAFEEPSKPVGPVFSEERARDLPYATRETARGYRRVVASPHPVTVVEKAEIRRLIEMDFIVICCGGGGIPVVREGRSFSGVDAVIDKDLASARLTGEVGVDVLLIATDVPGVALDYGGPGERFLRAVSVGELLEYRQKGHFPAGSMGPKIEAACEFIRQGGRQAVICSIEQIERAVEGEVGTVITG